MAGRGRASKTSPRIIATAQRRAEALKMRLAGARYDEITEKLGYSGRGAAAQDVQRALAATVQEPAEEVRALELSRLDMLWHTVIEILRQEHVVVSQGRVVFLNETPIADTGPILAAVDRLLKIQERRAKYLGLDAPKQLEVVSLDLVEQEIRRLNDELARAAANSEDDADSTDQLDGVEVVAAGGTSPADG